MRQMVITLKMQGEGKKSIKKEDKCFLADGGRQS